MERFYFLRHKSKSFSSQLFWTRELSSVTNARFCRIALFSPLQDSPLSLPIILYCNLLETMMPSSQMRALMLLAAIWPCVALDTASEDHHLSKTRGLEEFLSVIDLSRVDWSAPFQHERFTSEFSSSYLDFNNMKSNIERSNDRLSLMERQLRRTKSESSSSSMGSMKKIRSSSEMSKSTKTASPTIPCYERTAAPTKSIKSSSKGKGTKSQAECVTPMPSSAPTVSEVLPIRCMNSFLRPGSITSQPYHSLCLQPERSFLGTISTFSFFNGPVVKADGTETFDTSNLGPGDVWPAVSPVFDEDDNEIGTVVEMCSVVAFNAIFFCEGVYLNLLNGAGSLNFQGSVNNFGGFLDIIGGTGVYEGAAGFIVESFSDNTAFRNITLV